MISATRLLLCILFTSIGVSAREIRIAGQNFPPFNWVNEKKEMIGPMVDLFKDICKELGHTCKFEEMAIARSTELLANGELDIYLSNIPSQERSTFTSTGIPARSVYFANVKSKIGTIKDISQLEGYTAAGVRGAPNYKTLEEHAKKVKNLQLKEVPDLKTLVERIGYNFYGPKSVGIALEAAVLHLASKLKDEKIETIFVVAQKEMSNVYSKKMTDADVASINALIEKYKKDGTIKKIFTTHNFPF